MHCPPRIFAANSSLHIAFYTGHEKNNREQERFSTKKIGTTKKIGKREIKWNLTTCNSAVTWNVKIRSIDFISWGNRLSFVVLH